jgi:hypothetical protein
MYARTNRCYSERGSRTNYVRLAYPTVLRKDTFHCERPLVSHFAVNTITTSLKQSIRHPVQGVGHSQGLYLHEAHVIPRWGSRVRPPDHVTSVAMPLLRHEPRRGPRVPKLRRIPGGGPANPRVSWRRARVHAMGVTSIHYPTPC